MLGIRMNVFSENNLGEPEQDANSALTELDKGLRSGRIGEQCEAIVRFPKLFEKYPFPILINASFLKLAEIFRLGNNFLRLCVLRVCQQSEKHLDKISNVDEFVRKVYNVLHCNDSIGRAITLRTFGSVAPIMPERQQIHHSIRSSLDSHDNVEVEAAIYASIQFAAQSKTFAVSMCNKVSEMIQGQTIPANMKLQLIPILQYMHHDTLTASMARNLCLNLLPSYPSEDFVQITLNTLSQLAGTTLVDIPAQIKLLLKYLKEDPRGNIKAQCMKHLYELARPGAHLWPRDSLDEIIEIAMNSTEMLNAALSVIKILVESPKLAHENVNVDSKLRILCSNNSYSDIPEISAKSIQIHTQILVYCFEENIPVDGTNQVISALETLILLLTFSDVKCPKELKIALECAVSLCEAKQEYCETFVELLGTRLTLNNEFSVSICETLSSIGGIKPETLLTLIDDILILLTQLSEANSDNTQIKTMLATLIFQTLSGYTWNSHTENTLLKLVSTNNFNGNYEIAGAAVRYGHHKLSSAIFNELKEQVSSEHYHFWLVCLKEMCAGESVLYGEISEELLKRLDGSIVHYNKALAALKAASTPSSSYQFQAEYMKIRAEFLQCLIQLVYTCNILCIVPPPAIAAAIVVNTRDEHQRHGYITNQLRKCVKDFRNVGEMYWKLYQTAFDADPATLENLQILQQICVLVEHCVESICTVGGSSVPYEFTQVNARLESKQLINACENAVKISRAIVEQTSSVSTITHKQIDLLKKIVEVLTNVSLPIPRYFFEVLQSTSVKLAISPQPRVMGEFISVHAGSQLAVKVEGVIQHGAKPGLFRSIREVLITVTSQFQNNPKGKDIEAKNLETCAVLTQTVSPHRDFFTAQFLLAFPRGGQFVLMVEAALIDEHSNTWKTGPRSNLTVKIPDETKLAPITVPGMQSNANVILMPEDKNFIRPHQKKN